MIVVKCHQYSAYTCTQYVATGDIMVTSFRNISCYWVYEICHYRGQAGHLRHWDMIVDTMLTTFYHMHHAATGANMVVFHNLLLGGGIIWISLTIMQVGSYSLQYKS